MRREFKFQKPNLRWHYKLLFLEFIKMAVFLKKNTWMLLLRFCLFFLVSIYSPKSSLCMPPFFTDMWQSFYSKSRKKEYYMLLFKINIKNKKWSIITNHKIRIVYIIPTEQNEPFIKCLFYFLFFFLIPNGGCQHKSSPTINCF